MTEVLQDILVVPPGYRSREVGLFVAQMDEQSRCLTADLAGLTPEEAAWQPASGMNSIGMLLAHIAIVEVFWVQIGLAQEPEYIEGVLAIGVDDDGMPQPAGAKPPAALAGKDLTFFRDLLERARAHTKQKTEGLLDDDLDSMVRRHRVNRPDQEFNKRWVLYHMLEHEAGHYGQINLLRHLYKTRSGTA